MKRFLIMVLSIFMLFTSMGNGSYKVYAEPGDSEETIVTEPEETEETVTETEEPEVTEATEPAEELPAKTEAEVEVIAEPEGPFEPEETAVSEETEVHEETAEPAEEPVETEETPAETAEEPSEMMEETGRTAYVTYVLPEGASLVIDGQTYTGSYSETINDFDGYFKVPDNAPVKDGWNFVYWTVTANGIAQGKYWAGDSNTLWDDENGTEITDQEVTIICEPYFEKKYTFTVNYHLMLDGATMGEDAGPIVTRSYEDMAADYFGLPRPYKEGKEYLGWALTEGGAAITKSEFFETLEAGNTTIDLYAVWQDAVIYKVIYRVDPADGYLYLDGNGQPVYEYTDEYSSDRQLSHVLPTFLYPVSTNGKVFNGWFAYDQDIDMDTYSYPGDQIWFTTGRAMDFDENHEHVKTASWTDGEQYDLRLHLNGGALENRSAYVTDFILDGDTATAKFTQYDVNNKMILPGDDYIGTKVQWPISKTNAALKGWSKLPEPTADDPLYEDLGSVFAESSIGDIDLYAIWDEQPVEQKYTVEYVFPGASMMSTGDYNYYSDSYSETVDLGSDYYVSQNKPERSGYVFRGWTITTTAQPDAQPQTGLKAGECLSGDVLPAAGGKITLTAEWVEDFTFTITYMINREDAVYVQTGTNENITAEKHISCLKLNDPTPSSPTSVHLGWAFESNAEYGVSFDEIKEKLISEGTNEITLYGVWKDAEHYNVIYQVNEGEGYWLEDGQKVCTKTQALNEIGDGQFDGTALDKPENERAEQGYVFAYWKMGTELIPSYGEFNLETLQQAAEVIDGVKTVTLTAQWEQAETYTATLHLNGGTLDNEEGLTKIDNDTYQLSFTEYNLNSLPLPYQKPDNSYHAPWAVSKPKYVLIGWTPDPQRSWGYFKLAEEIFRNDNWEVIPADVDLYPIWEEKIYSIDYMVLEDDAVLLSGDISGNESFSQYNAEDGVTINCNAIRNGYTLAGWAVSKEDAAAGRVTFVNGQTADDYFDAQESSSKYVRTNLYAVWTAEEKTYTASFYLNKGTLEGYKANSKGLVKVPVTTASFATFIPERKGYDFTGWYTDSKLQNEYTAEDFANTPKNITLYAGWEGRFYIVRLNANASDAYFITEDEFGDGEHIEDLNCMVKFGENSVIEDKPIRSGYTFKGWAVSPEDAVNNKVTYKNGTKYTAFAEDPQTSEVVDLYAVWSLDTYTLKLTLNSGTYTSGPVGDVKLSKGVLTGKYTVLDPTILDNIVDPVDDAQRFTRNGYIFEGWYTDKKLTKKYDLSTMEPGNITLFAKWTAKTYTIHFDPNQGIVPVPETFTPVLEKDEEGRGILDGFIFNKKQKMTVKVSKMGYKFLGWSRDPEATKATYKTGKSYKNYSTDGEDVTLYAVWKLNTYTMKLYVNGGTFNKEVMEAIGMNAPEIPVKKGIMSAKYTIENPDAATYIFAPAEGITDPELSGVFTKKGYTFGGWFKDKSFKKPFSLETDFKEPKSITLYAKWIPNQYTVRLHLGDAYAFIGEDGPRNPDEDDYIEFAATFNKKRMAEKVVPLNTGYTFLGWAISEEEAEEGIVTYKYGKQYKSFAKAYDDDPMEGCIVDLYPVFELTNYKTTLVLNGGTIDGLTVKKGKASFNYTINEYDEVFGQYVYNSAIVSRKGYTFAGWYRYKTCPEWALVYDSEEDYIVSGRYLGTTLYAKWIKN